MFYSSSISLFIFLLFNFILCSATLYDEPVTSRNSIVLKDRNKIVEDSSESSETREIIEKTILLKNTTQILLNLHDLNYDDKDTEIDDHDHDYKTTHTTHSTTQRSSSSFLFSRLTQTKLSSTNVSQATTTVNSKLKDEYSTETNRDEFLLRIFVIVFIISIVSLSIVLITIYLIRKKKRYHGYGNPS